MEPFNVPIVLIVFNRPEITEAVFRVVKNLRPKQVFIIADGPRPNRPEDVERCQQVRAVLDPIDWPCSVLQNYSDTNLGCRNRVTSGLDWVFSQVESAIILEDDCRPTGEFFSFCQTLLQRYQNDQRIWAISGNNFQDGQWRGDGSYYFSKYFHCWGWATWRRAWQQRDFSPEHWLAFRDAGLMQTLCDTPRELTYWTRIFNKTFLEDGFNSWAYPWLFNGWAQSGLCILPNVNLVSNAGFTVDATHTRAASHLAAMATKTLAEIKHPSFLVTDKQADRYTFSHYYDPDGGKPKLWLSFLRWQAALRRKLSSFNSLK